ncbi:hypothetical protein HYV56_01865 [Candidatus Peregrinibacteria bacterium]|nr:hypothetical protein [Candidatus Peregrinibacteria bacterium]
MTKIIGIKELQTKTKKIREDVKKGIHFIVVWRSKPIFEISPFEETGFANLMKSTNLYTEDFIRLLEEAEEDVRKGRTKTFKNTTEFLKSLT